ncbi:MAG: NADH-quinone oxidoreductase subunit N [Halieaceae bacterium]|jgi:NADH-quinone oxidoreductase subunit N
MTSQDFHAISPLIVMSVGIIVLMLQIAFSRGLTSAWVVTSLTLLASLYSMIGLDPHGVQVTPLLLVDALALMFIAVILAGTLVTALLAKEYLEKRPAENEEFFLLLLLSALGGCVLVCASHVASLLLGLELMGVALYGLIAYPEKGERSLEAAIKYLVLSGAASATLLFGFALLYAVLGTMDFAAMAARLQSPAVAENPIIVLAASAFILSGLGFKLSIAPFHMWTPDVYEGAPAPVTGFLATLSKGAVFVVLLRWFIDGQLYQYRGILLALSTVAIASMLVGNFLALRQNNIKRILAYSSIAHFGYLLVVLVACGALAGSQALATEAASYYLLAYVVTTLAATSLITLLSSETAQERDGIDDITGLFWRRPLLSLGFTVALLSFAGIPMTAGFIGKFYIFKMGADAQLWALLSAVIIGSGLGIFYYLRLIYAMTKNPKQGQVLPQRTSLAGRGALLVLTLLILALGVYPQPLMDYLTAIL